MTKILMIDIGSHFGGAEKHIFDLVNEAEKKFPSLNFHIVVRKSNRLYDLLNNKQNSNVEFYLLKETGIEFNDIFRLVKYIKKQNIEVMHAHTVASNILGCILSLLTKAKVVTTIHGIINYDYPNRLKKTIYRILERSLLKLNNKYICVSKFVYNDLMKNHYNKEKLSIIYNGVIVKKSNPEYLEKLRRKYGLNGSKVLGTVARLEKVKNIQLLLEITKEIKKDNQDVKVLIVGEGEQKHKLKRYTEELNIQNNIIFLGFKENPYPYIELMDIYVQTSLMETFGLTVIEAVKLGKQVTCFNIGALTEFQTLMPNRIYALQEKSNFVPKIKHLLEEGNDYNKDSINDLFNWENCIKEINSIYIKMVKDE
ncbi:glycosyltransferase [Peribacillus muralis]|uniref:glycosyltransferase n=1 Tax=Peribacillus muralis TaxID=264697 RepID=UPI00070C069A|nr:glycosyltransferase [Peribacillus muralis]